MCVNSIGVVAPREESARVGERGRVAVVRRKPDDLDIPVGAHTCIYIHMYVCIYIDRVRTPPNRNPRKKKRPYRSARASGFRGLTR